MWLFGSASVSRTTTIATVLTLGIARVRTASASSGASDPGSGIRTVTTVTPAIALTMRPPMASSTLLTCATVAGRTNPISSLVRTTRSPCASSLTSAGGVSFSAITSGIAARAGD